MLIAVKNCCSDAALSGRFEFQCADCEVEHIGLTATLPAGWRQIDYEGVNAIRCADCLDRIDREHGVSVSVEPAGEPIAIDAAGWAYVDGDLQMLHSGCRVTYWSMPEVTGAVLHIRGGRTGGTAAALTVLDHEELSMLIDELRAVQDAIAPVARAA